MFLEGYLGLFSFFFCQFLIELLFLLHSDKLKIFISSLGSLDSYSHKTFASFPRKLLMRIQRVFPSV